MPNSPSLSQGPQRVIRDIRQGIPSGYILGRISPGTGKAELISIQSLATALTQTGQIATSAQVNTQDLIDAEGNVLDLNNAVILVP